MGGSGSMTKGKVSPVASLIGIVFSPKVIKMGRVDKTPIISGLCPIQTFSTYTFKEMCRFKI